MNKCKEIAATGRGQPLLQEPRFGSAPVPCNGPAGSALNGGPSGGPSVFSGPGYYDDGFDGYGRSGPFRGPAERYPPRGPPPDRFGRGGYEGGPGGGGPGAVCMVYGLNMDKMNCDRLFNFLCLYCNVVRESKPENAS